MVVGLVNDRRRNRRHSPTRAGLPTCRECNTVSLLDPCRRCAPAEVLATYPPDPREEKQMYEHQEYGKGHEAYMRGPDADEQAAPDEREHLDGHEAQDATFELGAYSDDDENDPDIELEDDIATAHERSKDNLDTREVYGSPASEALAKFRAGQR